MSRFSLIVSDLYLSFVSAKPASRGFMIDVEQADGAELAELVLRGEDKHVVGKTDTPADAELAWNDETGVAHRVILAEGEAEHLKAIQSQLLAFYTSEADFPTRVAGVSGVERGREALSLLLPLFGCERRNKNSHKVTTFAKVSDGQKAQKQKSAREQLEAYAKMIQNREAMAQIVQQPEGVEILTRAAEQTGTSVEKLMAVLVSALAGA